MKLVCMIMEESDADRVVRSLVRQGYPATRIGGTGGFLRRGNVTILSGVGDDEVDAVIGAVRLECPARTEILAPGSVTAWEELGLPVSAPLQVRVGGAIIFVLPVDRFERT